MNGTYLNSNVTTDVYYYYYSVDQILNWYGSYLILDELNLYLVTSVSLIGFALNVVSYFILSNRSVFRPSLDLFKYLRVYSVNNAVFCLLTALGFVQFTYRIFPWTNSYWPFVYIDYIFVPVQTILYTYCSFLNIAILIDRIAIYDRNVSNWLKLSAGWVSLIGFGLCVIINLPYYFIYNPESATYQIDSVTNFTIWFSGISEFGQSSVGKGFNYALFFIRDFLLFVIEGWLNVVSTLKLREFLRRKQYLTNGNRACRSENITGATVPSHLHSKKSASAETKATVVVIILITMSLIEHLISITSNVYSLLSVDAGLFYLYMFANLALAVKRVFNFLVLFIFNKNFKNSFIRFINCYC